MFEMMPWKKTTGKELSNFRREMDSLFERFFSMDFPLSLGSAKEGRWSPRVDIIERENDIRIKAEIPGVDAKDIDLKLQGRILSIKGEKKEEREEKEENYRRLERSYGYFNRTLELPAEVDPETIEAQFKKGVLTVVVKKTQVTEAKKVEIQTN